MLRSSVESEEGSELDPITQACLKAYPDQINVIQAISKVQHWQNGPDPLDFINIYINNDSLHDKANPYFHYVSLGLSDLYGDERIFKHSKNPEEAQSGYGFELTIKVKISQPYDIRNPPTWPFKIMQGIARYIYNGGIIIENFLIILLLQ
jgi:suppressor of fused-like protein